MHNLNADLLSPTRLGLVRRIVTLVCLLLAIAMEVGTLWVERDMLRRMTTPELAALWGLSSLAWLLVLVELAKLPFAALMHVCTRRSWWIVCLGGMVVASLVSFEGTMVTASKVHELAIGPATAALAAREERIATIARLEQANQDLASGATDLAAEGAKVRAEADAESKRREQTLDDAVAGLQRELQLLASEGEDPVAVRIRELQSRRDGLQPPSAIVEEVRQLDQRLAELDSRRNDEETKGRAEVVALRHAAADRRDRGRESTSRDIEARRSDLVRRLESATSDRRAAEAELTSIAETLAARLKEADAAGFFDRGRLRAEATKAHDDAKALAESKRATAIDQAKELERQISSLSQTGGDAAESEDPAAKAREAALASRLADLDGQRASLARQRDDRRAAMQAQLDKDRAALDTELSSLSNSIHSDIATRAKAVSLRREQLSNELAQARLEAATAITEIRQGRDARLTELAAAAVGPAEALRRAESNRQAILEAREQITQLERQAAEARRGSPVVQLARIFSDSRTGDPSDAEVQWTLRWLVPIIALVVAVVPALLLKASLASLAPRPGSRRRPWRALRRLMAMRTARADRERAAAVVDREAAIAARDAALASASREREEAAAATTAHRSELAEVRQEHASSMAQERSDRQALATEHRQHLEEQARRADERHQAVVLESQAALEAAQRKADEAIARAQSECAAAVGRADARADAASHQAIETLRSANAEIESARAAASLRVQSALKSTSRRMRAFRKRAHVIAQRRVLRTITVQQGKIGALSQRVESLEQDIASVRAENAGLRSLLNQSRDENIDVRRETFDLLHRIPTARVSIDMRGMGNASDAGEADSVDP